MYFLSLFLLKDGTIQLHTWDIYFVKDVASPWVVIDGTE